LSHVSDLSDLLLIKYYPNFHHHTVSYTTAHRGSPTSFSTDGMTMVPYYTPSNNCLNMVLKCSRMQRSQKPGTILIYITEN